MAKSPFSRFATKGEARANAQRLLRKYETTLDEPIRDPQDVADVNALMDNHPDAEAIEGDLVLWHAVRADGFGGRGFQTYRLDGTWRAWSYQTALRGERVPARTRVRQALRCEVEEDIAAARSAWILRHPLVDDARQAHHGRPWPFRRIVAHFLRNEDLTLDIIAFTEDDERVGARWLADRDLAARWRAFHAERANIKFLSGDVHARITAVSRPEPWEDEYDFEGCTDA